MSSYCLKCRKNTEIKNLRVIKTKNGIFFQIVRFVAVKNRDLLKCKKKRKRVLTMIRKMSLLGKLVV